MTEVITRDAQSLADQILDTVREDKVALPPFPELFMRVQRILSEDDTDAEKVARAVSVDPGLVASLLRVANSAAFGGLQQITDLKQVIARLGLTQVGSITAALQVKGQFADDHSGRPDTLQTLWDHSVTSAFAAQRLAEKVEADAGQAFLAGLLHDCGNLLVLKAVDHLRHSGQLEIDPTEPMLREMMDRLHCELGHFALTTWNFPEPLPSIVLHHEDAAEGGTDPLLLCVQAADLITRKLGFALSPDPELLLLQEPAIENLALDDIMLATLMVDLEDHLEQLRSVF